MKFEVSYPSGVKNEVELEGTSALLGRDPGCDLVLNDVKCSRRHAIIEAGPEGMLIRDNGSANGIYVNGKKVDSAELAEGDQIRLGQIVVTVLGEDVPATVAMDAMEFADIEETEPLPRPAGGGAAESSDSTASLPPQAPPSADAEAKPDEEEEKRPSSAVRGPATPPEGRPSPPPRYPTPPPRAAVEPPPAAPPESPPFRPAPPPPAVATSRPRAEPPRQHSPPAPPAPPVAPRTPRPPASRPPRPATGGPAEPVERPVTLTLIAALWLLAALVYAGGGIGMAFFSGIGGAGTVVTALFGIAAAAVAGAVGWGIWTLSPWARIAQIVLAGLGILSCVGTLPSIAILVYMLRPEVPVLFSGIRDRRHLDERQSQALAAAGSDTLFAVGILVALMVSCLLAVGLAWTAYWYLDAAGPGGPFAGS